MDKAEFLQTLRARLAQMPPEELEKNLAYYEELFDDMLEEGMSEEVVSEKLGDPSDIAAELLAELPLGELVKSRVRPKGGWTALSIVLIVLGSPIWLTLLIVVASVLLAVVVTLWALVLSAGAVVLAVAVAAVALVFAALFGYLAAPPLLLIGLGLLSGGAGILGVLLVIVLCRWLGRFCAWLFRRIKTLLIKKEG